MEKLKLHQNGKIEYLNQLNNDFEIKMKGIETDKNTSAEEKKSLIQKLKNEHKRQWINSFYYVTYLINKLPQTPH